jgi:serine/threonine-protein kinase HipA
MQWKLSARSNASGLTVRGSDGDQAVIVKFEAPGHLQIPRVEAATMAWAERFGISIPKCGLRNASEFDELPDGLPIGEGDIFVIERFDRSLNKGRVNRIHMEDFAQILDRPLGNAIYDGSYEMIAKIIAVLCPQDLMELFRRVVFSVCCGNGDAHLKNFSLQYLEGRRARLSPGYDLVATAIYGDKDLALDLGGSKDWMITNERFDQLIQLLRLEPSIQANLISGMLQRAGETFLEIQSQYPDWHRNQLLRHFERVPLLKPLHDLIIRQN